MVKTKNQDRNEVLNNTDEELRGSIMKVLPKLLKDGRDEEVLEIFAKLVELNNSLQKRVTELLMRRRKGEGVSSAQLKLFLEQVTEADDPELEKANAELKKVSDVGSLKKKEKEQKDSDKQPRMRQPIPENLRRIDNVIEVKKEERPCPVCGAERECIGHDISETIELIPAEVVVRVDKREKLACKSCQGELVRAENGDKIISGGKFGLSIVASILIDKYRDGLPLNRIKQRLARLGLSVPISTLADQVRWATERLQPIWIASQGAVLGSAVMQIDGTGLVVRDVNHPAKIKMGTLWGYIGDSKTALYLYTSTGKKVGQNPTEIGPEQMLSLRSGYTVADASNLFDLSFKRDELIECGCNMHARRYFKKALDAGDERAALAIAAFKKLYIVEAEIANLSPEKKLEIRQEKSVPVYDELVKWCELHLPKEPPSTPFYSALRYLLNHQLALKRFLHDGILPMDNGAIERLHIRVALTRKNFLFAGSDAGAHRAAIIYSILGSCALLDIDPYEYLVDVLSKLSKKIRASDAVDFLPMYWKLNRDASKNS